MEDFVTLLKALLVAEHGHTEEEAEYLVKKHSSLVIIGIMHGNLALRATAIAIEIQEAS